MKPHATAEHRWLTQLVGEWTSRATCSMPGDASSVTEGREVVRAIGEVWVVGEATMTLDDGGVMTSVMTLGFDPVKDRFVGSWIGSPMTKLVVYEGTLDPRGDTLTLDCEGPAFDNPTAMVRYQDIVEIRGDNERALLSQVEQPDGGWQRFMEVVYRRAGEG